MVVLADIWHYRTNNGRSCAGLQEAETLSTQESDDDMHLILHLMHDACLMLCFQAPNSLDWCSKTVRV